MVNSKYFNQPEMTPALDFIGGRNKSFYIPAYQRYFSWSNQKIDRFFEDVVDDIGQRLVPKDGASDVDTVSFIGSVLCYENTTLRDIYPQVRDQVPEGVLSVIDGQQRLTVLITLSIVLHNYIRTCRQGPDGGWLHQKCLENMESLASMFRTTKPYGEVPLYPKMIRAFDDQWAIDSQKQYHSPVSYYAFCYGDFLREIENNPKARFNYDRGAAIPNLDNRLRDAHANFQRAVNRIKKQMLDICGGNDDGFPDVSNVFNGDNADLLQNLFNASGIPDGAIDFADNGQCKTARAILLAAYVMKKVYFLSLVTKDENYAFDIFDSLNTTGEPLTAYETFRPDVIRNEGLEEFRHSDARAHLGEIDGYLEKISVEDKAKKTAEMLVTFALAERGDTLSKKVHIQRKYIKDAYSKCDNKQLFTQHLMHVSDVWRLWSSKHPNILVGLDLEAQSIAKKVSEANFCLRFLRDAGHTIAIALIARFYANVKIQCINGDAGRLEKAAEMCDTVKAVAAFFAVWRSSREHTDGIEAHYRDMIKAAFSRTVQEQDWCVRDNAPSFALVQEKICGFLKNDGGSSGITINSKDTWVTQSKDTPIYRTNREVAKFVLLLAAHNTRPDPENPTCMKRVEDGVYQSLIGADIWDGDDYKTIEHICPRSGATDEIHIERLHRIGNLTLLPGAANSILGDYPWSKKRAIYRLLSAEDERDLEIAAAQAKAEGIPPDTVDRLCRSRYLPMTRTVAGYEDFYVLDEGEGNLLRAEYIESRGENILENAWEVLSEWLDFNED